MLDVKALLGRESFDDVPDAGKYLAGTRVVVTGAGGSIGSQLCRMIAKEKPAILVLVGHGEDSINRIYGELSSQYPGIEIEFVIVSVAQEYRMLQVFEKYQPDYVFHTAAHKHVPLMESNEQEAVRNNIVGTYNVAQASGYTGVKEMVFISTDKAVDPCCIMGMTKLFGEELMRVMCSYWPDTSFVTVRFGNVLGSVGSVIPLFVKQIESGGPVTVTHPDMTRYFMTETEAVSLVLQAGAFGASGEVYLLDMGEPIRITHLAENLIKSYGLKPYVDIQIFYSDIRPGEKVTEDLVSTHETVVSERARILRIIKPERVGTDEFFKWLHTLRYKADCSNGQEVRELLYKAVYALQGCVSSAETGINNSC